jgi:hypothetical protein
MSRRRTRFAVYLATVPDDFHPQRPWTLPEVFGEGILFAKNLPLGDAQGHARVFNRHQLQAGIPDNRWALVVRSPHDRGDPTNGEPAPKKISASPCLPVSASSPTESPAQGAHS